MRKETKVSQPSQKKSKAPIIDSILPLLDEDIPEHEIENLENDFVDGDLEPFEDDFSNDFSDVKFDESFLLNISDEKKIDAIENFETNKLKSKTEHPMDAYFKKIIKEVLIQDFLPILKQQLKKE